MKSGSSNSYFFFLVNHFSWTRKKSEFAELLFSNLKKMWIYSISPPFFLSTIFLESDFSNQISRTRFLDPHFYTFLEKWLQIKWSLGLAEQKKIIINFNVNMCCIIDHSVRELTTQFTACLKPSAIDSDSLKPISVSQSKLKF